MLREAREGGGGGKLRKRGGGGGGGWGLIGREKGSTIFLSLFWNMRRELFL
jgi:hypothetical protein